MNLNQVFIENIVKPYFEQGFNMPFDQSVVTAMRKVDRKDFLPKTPIGIYIIDAELRDEAMREIARLEQSDDAEKTEKVTELWKQYTKDVHEHIFRQTAPALVTVRDVAYMNSPISIGHGQTCSQPSMVAYMSHCLKLSEGMHVLEIGTGCGYHAAITAECIGAAGHLTSIEIIPELAAMAKKNLQHHFHASFESRITLVEGNGRAGFPQNAPYDCIYFTAGANGDGFIGGLSAQLKEHGKVLLPPEQGNIAIYTKTDEGFSLEQGTDVMFVPLQ
ncbi:protein-L-isoaspartate O-methyltransferase [Candidatus Woesearchaeota archaeon]|nr:MAG: protein-L-isoaspartate O-methyltransferase [Candidatus Woesearchaeota archaeon]